MGRSQAESFCPDVEIVYLDVEIVYLDVETVHPDVETVHPDVETVHPDVETVYLDVETVYLDVEMVSPSIEMVFRGPKPFSGGHEQGMGGGGGSFHGGVRDMDVGWDAWRRMWSIRRTGSGGEEGRRWGAGCLLVPPGGWVWCLNRKP